MPFSNRHPSAPRPVDLARPHRGGRWRALLAAVPLAGLSLAISACGTGHQSIAAVFPIPGSQVASPQTQIAFRGLPIDQLGRVTVTGSQTGRHTGRVLPDSDNDGGSFIPAKPFAAGETVTVQTQRPVRGAGRKFSFRIATPAAVIPKTPIPLAARLPGDVMSFHSRPDLSPAAIEITKQASGKQSGDIFLAPQQGPVQNGPMIIDASGRLVWFKPLPARELATDFRVQRYLGRPVLTWWQGNAGGGIGLGEDVIYDSSYRQLATVRAANGLEADLHEFQLTTNGHALITAYYPVYWDESSMHGPKRGVVLDSVVQEIDIKTGLLLFEWDSLDHVPLTASYLPVPMSASQPYDYFHVNAVQRDSDGDLVVSSRNAWAAYKLDFDSGKTIWTLGGKDSTFKIPAAAEFAFQHDVRVRDAGDETVTVFDDGAGPPTVHQQSRGLTLTLDPRSKVAKLSSQLQHTPPLLASYEGNLQVLPDGDEFLGWGEQPYFSEFDSAGQMTFDGRFVDANSSYRAYRFAWSGTPTGPPAIAASTYGATTTIYASWNGATGVVRWQVLAGATPSSLKPAGSFGDQDFETQMTVPAARYVAVRAIGAHGRKLSSSPTVRAG